MPIQLGDKALKSLYIWDKKVSAVYIWDKKVRGGGEKDFVKLFAESKSKVINRGDYYRQATSDQNDDRDWAFIKVRPEWSGKIKLLNMPSYSTSDLGYCAFDTHIDFTLEIEKTHYDEVFVIIYNPWWDYPAMLSVRIDTEYSKMRVSYGSDDRKSIHIPLNRDYKELFVSLDLIMHQNGVNLNGGQLKAIYWGQTYTIPVQAYNSNYLIHRNKTNTQLSISSSRKEKGWIAVKQIHIW